MKHTLSVCHLSKRKNMFTRIMLATDGSKLSQKAVKSAIDMASKFNAELVAVKVIPRYVQTYFEGSFTVADIDVKSIEAQWAAGAQVVLDKIATSAAAKGVSVKTAVIKSDDIADGLVKAANKMKVDLIVMASHGRKGVKRLLLGSETQNVLTHSEVPVLVLR
jgi:nucleotide-binding universal stress UspA family protein